MMLGAIIYRLRACNAGLLPIAHGRFMHAAFFAALQQASPELATAIHDNVQAKPFTVSQLQFMQPVNLTKDKKNHIISQGCCCKWRVTGWNDEILQVLLNLPLGYEIMVGKIKFIVERIVVNQTQDNSAGLVNIDDFMAKCLSVGRVKEIEFEFLAPVSFRSYKDDYPLPLPDFIWGSLCSKWNQLGTNVLLDENKIKTLASTFLPLSWQGQTKKLFLAKDRGILAFEGKFSFSVKEINSEEQTIIFLLAQFAFFAGVGRLTSQGLGQTVINFK